jgi:hypothetical protein
MECLNWFVQDVRYALRGFWRNRGFTLLAVVALALGIAAVTVIFSVIENVLIEPFPYRAPDRLAIVYVHDTTRPEDYRNPSYRLPEFLDIQAQNHVSEDATGNAGLDILYADREGTLQFEGEWVTPNSFEFLGIEPLLGRIITKADGKPRRSSCVRHELPIVEEAVRQRSEPRRQDLDTEWPTTHPRCRNAPAVSSG